MENLSTAALIVLGLVAFNNYRAGTLGDWLRAKFFNQTGAHTTAQPGGGGGGAGHALATLPQVYTGSVGGALVAPVAGATVTSPFGPRGSGFHAGIDLAVPDGTTVHAAKAGRVLTAGVQSGYGNLVVLDNGGGMVTKYAHLSTIGVTVGQDVAAGATLGLSGHTGDATGPHLHFEVLNNGVPVNPSPYLATAGLQPVSA